jgi:hypothetical protein
VLSSDNDKKSKAASAQHVVLHDDVDFGVKHKNWRDLSEGGK